MFCPKCRKPLFEENKCHFCDWVQVEPPRPIPQPMQQPATDKMPKSYYIDSWLLFGLCMLYGIIRGLLGLINGDEDHIYKGIIACCAACVFIPAIKVMKNPIGTLLVKILVVIGVIIII